MADTIPSSASHESKPSNSHMPSFIRLPAEIRNKIYAYLFHSSDPIRLSLHRDTRSCLSNPMMALQSDTHFPTALFRTCQQVNMEASSVLYSGNEFSVGTAGGTWVGVCPITALEVFLVDIGSQARLLRVVLLDGINKCTNACHRSYIDWNKLLFDADTNVTQVTSLLRLFWSRRLRFNVSLSDSSGETFSPYNKAFLSVVQALLHGQLGLKHYGSLVCGIAVKFDGSGGLISWGSTPPRGIHNTAWPRYYPHTTTPFTTLITDTGETELKLVPRSTPTLLSLPKNIRSHIINLVVFPPGESTEINVDTATAFPLGLPHVNKQLYASLWPVSLIANRSYVLRTCTTTARSDFDNFSHLRRLLRKNITYIRPDGMPVALTLKVGYPGIKKIILVFNLETSIRVEDLRISILPLVMEMSGVSLDVYVVVKMCCENDVWERSIRLGKLRGDVLGALEGVPVSEVDNREGKWEPKVWINGLGEVVEGGH